MPDPHSAQARNGGGAMTTLTASSQLTDGCDVAMASAVDRLIRISTAVAVLAVASVAAYVSYWHAYAVVRTHGESGLTARLEPATIDGLVYASSMVILYAARHGSPVPRLARWLLGLGIAATLTANMAQGWSHGPVGAAVAAWPAVSLVGSYELLVWLIRTAGTVERGVSGEHPAAADGGHHGRSEFSSAAGKGRRTSQQGCNDDTLRREDSGDNVNDEAVAAYQMSVQAGNPLSERKLAQMFGRTSRRWARARISHARQVPLPAALQETRLEPLEPQQKLESHDLPVNLRYSVVMVLWVGW